MLTSVRQAAEELLNLVEPTIKDSLDSFSLLDTVVDAQTQSPRSFYAYLLLNEKCDLTVPLKADNEYMPPVLANILFSTLSKEIDEILMTRRSSGPLLSTFYTPLWNHVRFLWGFSDQSQSSAWFFSRAPYLAV